MKAYSAKIRVEGTYEEISEFLLDFSDHFEFVGNTKFYRNKYGIKGRIHLDDIKSKNFALETSLREENKRLKEEIKELKKRFIEKAIPPNPDSAVLSPIHKF
jgi:HD superfamily phosphodiesterase